MSNPIQFKDVTVGQKFVFNEETYTKIVEERISCCKALNALKDSNQEKCMILPLQEVQIVN